MELVVIAEWLNHHIKNTFYDFQLDHFRCWWDFRSENDNWNIISLFLIRLAENSNSKKSKMSRAPFIQLAITNILFPPNKR